MNVLKRIVSDDKRVIIDVVESSSGGFELHQYSNKYDPEEEVFYEVRVLPGPSSKFGDLESAVIEAQNIVE